MCAIFNNLAIFVVSIVSLWLLVGVIMKRDVTLRILFWNVFLLFMFVCKIVIFGRDFRCVIFWDVGFLVSARMLSFFEYFFDKVLIVVDLIDLL